MKGLDDDGFPVLLNVFSQENIGNKQHGRPVARGFDDEDLLPMSMCETPTNQPITYRAFGRGADAMSRTRGKLITGGSESNVHLFGFALHRMLSMDVGTNVQGATTSGVLIATRTKENLKLQGARG